MNAKKTQGPDSYLVPFGRERGGYLDRLNLPPDATPTQAAKRHGDFRFKLESKFKEGRKSLQNKHKEQELTREELEEQVRTIEEEWNRSLAELNELKGKFDALQAQRRRLANEGHKEEDESWLKMVPTLEGGWEEFWGLARRPRPVPRCPDELVAEIEGRWLRTDRSQFMVPPNRLGSVCLSVLAEFVDNDPESLNVKDCEAQLRKELEREAKEARQRLRNPKNRDKLTPEEVEIGPIGSKERADRELGCLEPLVAEFRAAGRARERKPAPSNRTTPAGGGVDLAALSDLLTEGDLIGLLAADAIWGELAYTNRSYWRDRVNTWVNEVAAIAPRLRPPENSAGPPRPRPEFPALHRTPDAFIERLEREPIGEESQES